ncbi:transposase [Patescibacteria group bacterium]|nr:transposase [Patescibacteria group bacterium]MBU1935357.1 transposase [Patescibacteria group bacterium]
MPKRKIELVNEQVYHVYNRGIRKERIFGLPRDYERFLVKVGEYKKKYGIQVIAWALIPNHFHMLVRAVGNEVRTPNQIISFFLKLQQSHAMYFKNQYEKIGPVFQGRFNAKPVDDEDYLIKLLHYVHGQPSHHKICSDWDWPYSSLSHYLSSSPDSDLLHLDDYRKGFEKFEGIVDSGLDLEFEI